MDQRMDPDKCCPLPYHSHFFPYRRVIQGGKLLILPLRDSAGNLCGFKEDNIQGRPVQGDVGSNDCGCLSKAETRAAQCTCTTPIFPPLGDDHHIPLSGAVKAAINPTDYDLCQKLVTPLQRLGVVPRRQTELHRQLKARIADIEEKSHAMKQNLPSPLALFGRDEHFLLNAYRNYKNDIKLSKERGTYLHFYENPKQFPDESSRRWYYDMVKKDKPCLDTAAYQALYQTDCAIFANEVDVPCFLCPPREIPTWTAPVVHDKMNLCDC